MTFDFENAYNELQKLISKIGLHHFLCPATLYYDSLPYINLSYSSSGEDLWLRQFMKPRLRTGQPGFYVDIGANLPYSTSNSFLFYCMGWRGICIDANPRFREEFSARRPRDILINAAVSDLGQSLYFAEALIPAGHKLGRVSQDAGGFSQIFGTPLQVPAMTMAEVLKQHLPENTTIDFMTIDLEDSKLPAIRSNDWSVFKPRVILIEAGNGFDPLVPYDFPTIAYLRKHGYHYQGYSSNNVLMTSENYGDSIV